MPRRGPRSQPSKYQPIANFLATQEAGTVRLTFPEIETILGFPLPNSAYVDGIWWRDTVHPYVRAWEALGWEARLHILARIVVFTRLYD